MDTTYLLLVEQRFKRNFPKSHLIVSYERSIHYSGTTSKWQLWIRFDELEDLEPIQIHEYFDEFKDLDNRLSYLMYREAETIDGIKEEILVK